MLAGTRSCRLSCPASQRCSVTVTPGRLVLCDALPKLLQGTLHKRQLESALPIHRPSPQQRLLHLQAGKQAGGRADKAGRWAAV
jgi:hypothetical protein